MNAHGNERQSRTNANDKIRLSPTEARQGSTPHVTRYVLRWGLGLSILAFALIYFLQR